MSDDLISRKALLEKLEEWCGKMLGKRRLKLLRKAGLDEL